MCPDSDGWKDFTMQLLTDGTEIPLPGGVILSASYQPNEAGEGLLNLCCTSVGSYDSRTVSLLLDPWNPEGYRVEQALGGSALVLCGATRIVVIELSSLRLTAAIPFESEECKRQGLPWFVLGPRVMLICTETRVFCLDERLAFRWIWTVLAYSKDWWEIARPPSVDASQVQIALTALGKTADVKIDLGTAAALI